jgi:hypothetical protein
VIVAVAYGVAYWAGLVRGFRKDWAARLRDANLHLAAATCVLALVLALPLFDFGAISARNQVARLESGRVSAEEFDFTALRWDFGDAGRRALARLAEGEGEVAELAATALAQTERVWDWQVGTAFTGTLRVQPENAELRERVETLLGYEPWRCDDYCVALDLGGQPNGTHAIALVQRNGYERLVLPPVNPDGSDAPVLPMEPAAPSREARNAFSDDTRVEIREESTRYIYVDGQKMGGPLE